jgi:hypothetical protein
MSNDTRIEPTGAQVMAAIEAYSKFLDNAQISVIGAIHGAALLEALRAALNVKGKQ